MLAVISLSLLRLFGANPEWTWVSQPEAGFKVLVPVELEAVVREVPADGNTITYYQFHGGSLKDPELALTFVIDHYTLPPHDAFTDETSLREFFENTLDPLLKSIQGTILYMDLIREPGQEICAWKAAYQGDQNLVKGQFILSGSQYYGLQVFGRAADKPDTHMDKFLNSFQLLPFTR